MKRITPESVGFSASRLNRIGDWMSRQVDSGNLPGLQVLVARKGGVAYFETKGCADADSGRALGEDSVFRIYSMSKPITTVAAMMLYEEGLFQLDQPLARYLPEFAEMRVCVGGDRDNPVTVAAEGPITIKQIMTHTSGLTYGFLDESVVAGIYRRNKVEFDSQTMTLAEMVARLAEQPLCCQPGSEWNYSVSTDVLGRLVEVLSGTSLDRFLTERIFRPLKMADTGFHVVPAHRARFANCYEYVEDGAFKLQDAAGDSRFTKPAVLFSGGGGLVSTTADYLRFTQMLLNRGELGGVRLLGRKTVEFMMQNHLPGDLAAMGQPSFSETSYEGIGFGLGGSVVIDPARSQVISSPGMYAWGGLASTGFWVDPQEELTVILMTQLIPSSSYPIRNELRALVYQALVD